MGSNSDKKRLSPNHKNPRQVGRVGKDTKHNKNSAHSQCFDELKSTNEKADQKEFQKVLDKFYSEVNSEGASHSQLEDQLKAKLKKTSIHPLTYFQTQSSTYYKESQVKFEREYKKFEQRLNESLTDCKAYASDLFFSDGYTRKLFSDSDANHKYNKYEHYQSGYDTQFDLPTHKIV